jgi:hypothetical protein
MSIITTAVGDYGTRKLVTTAAVQENLYSYSAAMGFSEVDTTTTGVYRSPFTNIANAENAAVTGNSYTAVDAATDADILPIDRRALFSERIGAFDEVSFASGSLIADRAMNAAKVMAQSIDRFVINKAVGDAPSMLTNGGALATGVFSATPWTVSNTNALDIVNATIEEVNFNEGYGDDKFVLVDTSFVRQLTGFFQGTGNNVADETIRGGVPYVGMLAGGVKVFQSNNVPHYATITFGANPANDDTITINGVTWQFKTTLTGAAGQVLRDSSTAATTQANFLSALQNPDTTNAQHVALTLDNQNKIKNLEITAASVSTAVQISSKGAFRLTADFTSGSNTVSPVRKRLLAGSMRAVKVFVPTVGMKYQEKDAIGGLDGTEILMRQFFNSMTETRKAPLTVSVLTI